MLKSGVFEKQMGRLGLGLPPGQFTSREITAELRSVDGSETRPYTVNVPVPTHQILFVALIE